MNTETLHLLAWALAGLVATLVMDVVGGVVRKTGLTRGAPPQLVGRFLLSTFRGHFTKLDAAIPADASIPLGFIALIHYAIGIALGVLLGFGALLWNATPTWWLVILYGIGTALLPALWMFPVMGFGLCGLRGPAELRLLSTSLINHSLFGIGLALAAALAVPWF